MLTDLEAAILNAIVEANPDIDGDLRRVLANIQVQGRENTGMGFFTQFSVIDPTPRPWFGTGALVCPKALLDGLGDHVVMDFSLWLKDGLPEELEGYLCYGGVDLKLHDLADLRIKQLGDFPPPQTLP